MTRPEGPGHVLHSKSELTRGTWRIRTDNLAMARRLQATVQDTLDRETADPSIRLVGAAFEKEGDPARCWSERIVSACEEIVLTWLRLRRASLAAHPAARDPGAALRGVHGAGPGPGARLTIDGVEAVGKPRPRDREGRPFSTCVLAFDESWAEELAG